MSNIILTFSQNVGILSQIDLRMPKIVYTFLPSYVLHINTNDLEFPTDYDIWIIAEMFWSNLKTLSHWHGILFFNTIMLSLFGLTGSWFGQSVCIH